MRKEPSIEVFILEGSGFGFDGEKEIDFKGGDAVFVSPNNRHQSRNIDEKKLEFIYIVPYMQDERSRFTRDYMLRDICDLSHLVLDSRR